MTDRLVVLAFLLIACGSTRSNPDAGYRDAATVDDSGEMPTTLRNDVFEFGEGVESPGFAGYIDQDDCWASRYDLPTGSFRLRELSVLLGPSPATATAELRVYSVDVEGLPGELLGTTEIELTSSFFSASALHVVDLSDSDLGVLPADRVAIAVCKTSHDGPPTIAHDGHLASARDFNFLYDAGVFQPFESGQWIMRAEIEPAR